MQICEACKKEVEEQLQLVTDSYDNKMHVCKQCADKIKNNICIICGEKGALKRGMCPRCVQLKMVTEIEDTDEENGTMTPEQFETWITQGRKNVNIDAMRKNTNVRKMWILIKLKVAGISNENTKNIGEYYKKAEKMLERSDSKLLGTKCKLVISSNGSDIDTSSIIDKEDDLYIVRI